VEVNLPGFGKFTVKAVPARTGRNPSTGAAIQIAASKKVSFSPAKALKDKVNS
jgi:DNA-binding protein HU-beta